MIHILLPSFCIRFIWLYRVFPTYFKYQDRSLSSGQCYPPFEQLGAGRSSRETMSSKVLCIRIKHSYTPGWRETLCTWSKVSCIRTQHIYTPDCREAISGVKFLA